MIKYSLFLLALSAALSVFGTNDKFDGATRTAFLMTSPSRADEPLRALVLMSAGASAPEGVTVEARMGDVLVVEATPSQLTALAEECNEVLHISTGRPLQQSNNLARALTGADKIAAGTGLESSYKGVGVVTGIYDIGFDVQNPSFQADGHSRIERIFQYIDQYGTVTEYTVPVAIESFITDSPQNYHGTHVLGTIAGATGGLYDGFAAQSSIGIACGPLSEVNMASGLGKIIDYAVGEGKPCVVNLSVSDVLGPHDGSDEFAQALTALSEKAAVVVSAGNDGNTDISLCRDLDDTQRDLRTFLMYKDWVQPIAGAMAVWSGDDQPLKVTVAVVDRIKNEILSSQVISEDPASDPVVYITSDYKPSLGRPLGGTLWTDLDKAGADSWISVVSQRAPSGKHGYYIAFNIDVTKRQPCNEVVGVIAEGSPGQRVEMFLQSSSAAMRGLWTNGWSNGANDLSISSICCARDVISVGAYVDRVSWLAADGSTVSFGDYTDGDIAPWSSYGVLADGTALPVVAAPGASLISVLSTPYHEYYPDRMHVVAQADINGRKVYWAADQGTSMSAPVVVGSIATWLEADPSLGSSDIMDIIKNTATVDDAVRAAPVRFGAGKFDAYAGLKEVLHRKADLVGPSAVSPRIIAKRAGSVMELSVPGADRVDIVLTDISGRVAAHLSAEGDAVAVDTSLLTPGVYIAAAAGTDPLKIIVVP